MIGIVRLPVETNLGEDAQEVRFLILALCPTNEKGQYNYMEGGGIGLFITLVPSFKITLSQQFWGL